MSEVTEREGPRASRPKFVGVKDNGSEESFQVGSKIQIMSAAEILTTLDASGRCDGLPFMPQMVDLCGQQATIVRWVTSSCIPTKEGVVFGGVEEAVLLDVERCDGASFGGCQMNCSLIWKTAWLTGGANRADVLGESANAELRELAESTALHADGRANCQATQLVNIATPHRGSRLKQYAQEVNLNRVSVSAIATSFCSGVLARLSGAAGTVSGDLRRTPLADLGLEAGDRVRVRTRAEITDTLDTNGKNRGLWFDPVMLRYCGQELTVSKRVTVLVDETNGEIRQLKVPSVVLEDLRCEPTERRFCSRLLHLFWREVWLEHS